MKHSKEPWREHDMEELTIVAGKPGMAVASTDCFMLKDEIKQANMKRIVACVNACAGISIHALEKDVISEMRILIAALAIYENNASLPALVDSAKFIFARLGGK